MLQLHKQQLALSSVIVPTLHQLTVTFLREPCVLYLTGVATYRVGDRKGISKSELRAAVESHMAGEYYSD